MLYRPPAFAPTPPDRLKPYVTQWGADPLFESAAVDPTPLLAAFPRSAPAQRGTALSLAETPELVDVAGHAVGYDEGRRLWYADSEIAAGDSYFPCVRLALARYQPISVEGAHLSRVMLSDFVQLAPDRMASIVRDDAETTLLQVAVTGRSYDLLKNIAGPGQVEVSVEERRPGTDPTTTGELAWTPATADTIVLEPAQQRVSGPTVWQGAVTLPAGPGPFRIVIKEFDLYPVLGLVALTQRRLVYADAIEI